MTKDDVIKALNETIEILNGVENIENYKEQIEIARSIISGVLSAYKSDCVDK